MSDVDQLRAEMLREFGKLHRKADTMIELAERVSNRQIATDARVDNHAGRLRAVEIREEQRSIAEPGPNWRAETTGTYELQKLIENDKRRDSEHKWLRRHRYSWLSDLAKLALAAVAGWVASKLGK